MNSFLAAFEKMIVREGGYQLTNDPRDRGGQTYAGIARNANPRWPGWAVVDGGGMPSAEDVRSFYRANYWTPARLDEVADDRIASTLFDFGVNAGVATSVKLAQVVVGTTPDGQVGPKTLSAINAFDPELFLARYTLAKMARYAAIVKRDRSQGVYLLGWINRALLDAV